MSARFDGFVVLAGMRTGSNFLEETLATIPGIRMWGEAFNPHFMGRAGQARMAGLDLSERDADPLRLLSEMRRRTEGLAGFRLFHDHDPRVLAHVLADPRCAKVRLTRNPLESYVSLKIARATGQWRLGDMKTAKRAKVRFDAGEFAAHLAQARAFDAEVARALQTTGQTAFAVDYAQVGDIAVIDGLAAWLGVEGRAGAVSERTRVQNPEGVRDKVENPEEMEAALAALDPFGLAHVPVHEPERGAGVPNFVACEAAPLLFLPVAGGPEAEVTAWLGASGGDPVTGFTQKVLRRWKRARPGHRSFVVLRHPARRAHHVFCTRVLPADVDPDTRALLRERYGVPIPEGDVGPDWTAQAHRAAFLAWLGFVAGNLGGQTAVGVDAYRATQASLVQGIGRVQPPDLILREEEADDALAALARASGLVPAPWTPAPEPGPVALDAICDTELVRAVEAAYRRDFVMFGFVP